MKVLLDACVLYPTVMREAILGVAKTGLFQPLWSARILEEWARAGPCENRVAEAMTRGDIAMMRSTWPNSTVRPAPELEARLLLPDPDDVHVFASAIVGSADYLLTLNAKDFPQNTLLAEGVERRDPDGFLWELWSHDPDLVTPALVGIYEKARMSSDESFTIRDLFKRARLPRLGRALQG